MSRISHLSAAFRDLNLTCGALTLRPITTGTILLLMETENLLFSERETSEENPEEVSGQKMDSLTMQAIFEFIWIHTAPEEEVIRTCEDPAALRRAARLMALKVDISDLENFTDGFTKVRDRIQSAMVDPISEKGEATKKPSEEKLTPTGSPPSSSPSAEPEIPSESTSSSGDSPSIVPFNTTTPPSCTTETPRVGKSQIWETPPPAPPEEASVMPLE